MVGRKTKNIKTIEGEKIKDNMWAKQRVENKDQRGKIA